MTVAEEGRCIVDLHPGQAAVAKYLAVRDNPQARPASQALLRALAAPTRAAVAADRAGMTACRGSTSFPPALPLN
jgi:hypothetical protein